MRDEYYNTTEAKAYLRVSTCTLRQWDKKGKIRSIRTPSNHRLYHKEDVHAIVGIATPPTQERKKALYCRVSSKKQVDDLKRQEDFLREKFPDYQLVTDIGSGVNWKRKGLKTLLDQSNEGLLDEVVVAHRDRLCRFAFELIEYIFKSNGTKLVVLSEESNKSSEQELAEDLLSIVHIYSCRNMGRRRYKKQKDKDLSEQETSTDTQTVDGDK